jgi:hypothetical protein
MSVLSLSAGVRRLRISCDEYLLTTMSLNKARGSTKVSKG